MVLTKPDAQEIDSRVITNSTHISSGNLTGEIWTQAQVVSDFTESGEIVQVNPSQIFKDIFWED